MPTTQQKTPSYTAYQKLSPTAPVITDKSNFQDVYKALQALNMDSISGRTNNINTQSPLGFGYLNGSNTDSQKLYNEALAELTNKLVTMALNNQNLTAEEYHQAVTALKAQSKLDFINYRNSPLSVDAKTMAANSKKADEILKLLEQREANARKSKTMSNAMFQMFSETKTKTQATKTSQTNSNLTAEQSKALKMLFLRDPLEANQILGNTGSAWKRSSALQNEFSSLSEENQKMLVDFAMMRIDSKGRFKDVEGLPSASSMETGTPDTDLPSTETYRSIIRNQNTQTGSKVKRIEPKQSKEEVSSLLSTRLKTREDIEKDIQAEKQSECQVLANQIIESLDQYSDSYLQDIWTGLSRTLSKEEKEEVGTPKTREETLTAIEGILSKSNKENLVQVQEYLNKNAEQMKISDQETAHQALLSDVMNLLQTYEDQDLSEMLASFLSEKEQKNIPTERSELIKNLQTQMNGLSNENLTVIKQSIQKDQETAVQQNIALQTNTNQTQAQTAVGSVSLSDLDSYLNGDQSVVKPTNISNQPTQTNTVTPVGSVNLSDLDSYLNGDQSVVKQTNISNQPTTAQKIFALRKQNTL